MFYTTEEIYDENFTLMTTIKKSYVLIRSQTCDISISVHQNARENEIQVFFYFYRLIHLK